MSFKVILYVNIRIYMFFEIYVFPKYNSLLYFKIWLKNPFFTVFMNNFTKLTPKQRHHNI